MLHLKNVVIFLYLRKTLDINAITFKAYRKWTLRKWLLKFKYSGLLRNFYEILYILSKTNYGFRDTDILIDINTMYDHIELSAMFK